ncbi:MAG: 23S rRNA (uracil(1939)-C(5))-methyltransferase RlmD [Acidobacteriota bacterium]|nr:23S rRNA (uracil(1939)-C(5))-methyltransferase RlmD [Acidobacteriota bacterium]
MKVILASESPRRIRLLKKILKSFSVIPSGFDERTINEKEPAAYALEAAAAKARAVGEKYPDDLIIAADTVVTIDGLILGKPDSREEARKMLETLSGRTHQVITAIALFNRNKSRLLSDYQLTGVSFRPLSAGEIETYLSLNTFADKAGAYALQNVREKFIEEIKGDYYNVVGLPLGKLRQLLHRFSEEKLTAEISGFRLPEGFGLIESAGGETYLVPGAYPGDQVEIAFEANQQKIHQARLLSILRPSSLRRPAACPHFGLCGGCSFQDLIYGEQLHQKRLYLSRVLKKYFPADYHYFEVEDIRPSPSEYYYRNKMEFSFGQAEGEVYPGLREKTRIKGRQSDKKVVRLDRCLISSPLTETLFSLFHQLTEESGLPAFDLKTKQGFFRHLVIREGKNSGEMMVSLVTSSQAEISLKDFSEQLVRALPGIKSVWWVENDRLADVVSYEKPHLIYGQESIEDCLLGFRFKIHQSSFFQTNPLAAELVYKRIADEARRLRAQSAMGLYCGSGAIEICLSPAVGDVLGIDWDPANIKAANENAVLNGVKNTRFLSSPVESALSEISRGSFDLLIIDPPRAGLSPRAMKQIIPLRIPNLLYVSCHPETLARDLSILIQSGYRLESIAPVDFFPQTAHLEAIACLSR